MTTDHRIPVAGLLLATALIIGAAAVGSDGPVAATSTSGVPTAYATELAADRPTPTTTSTTAPPTTAAPRPAGAARYTGCEADFAAWMNQARAAAGVSPVSVDGGIAGIPVGWAQHMAERGTLAHNPDYSNQIRAVRPEARLTAENVGYATNGARTVFDGFMNSSGHRANILRSDHSRAATGCYRDAGGTTWVSVDFWG